MDVEDSEWRRAWNVSHRSVFNRAGGLQKLYSAQMLNISPSFGHASNVLLEPSLERDNCYQFTVHKGESV